MGDPLTKQQQELVETNHNLIYWFANKFNLRIDEYYDILSIGLCYAAKSYNKNQCKFSLFAFYFMRNEVYKYWRNKRLQRVIPDDMILSCDFTYNTDSECCENNLSAIISDNNYTDDIAVSKILFTEFTNKLSHKEKTVAELLVNGFTQKEIAKKLGCSKQSISINVINIRQKFSRYLSR